MQQNSWKGTAKMGAITCAAPTLLGTTSGTTATGNRQRTKGMNLTTASPRVKWMLGPVLFMMMKSPHQNELGIVVRSPSRWPSRSFPRLFSRGLLVAARRLAAGSGSTPTLTS